MPIYEYHCDNCNKDFETLVRRASEAVHCPGCGSENLTRKLSAHAVGSPAPDTACGSSACAPMPACGAGACPACE